MTEAWEPKFLFSGKYEDNFLKPFLSGFLWTRVYATLLPLPPLIFHCVGGFWDCCDFDMAVIRYNHSARSYQRLGKLSSSTLTNLIHKTLVFFSFYLIKVKQEWHCSGFILFTEILCELHGPRKKPTQLSMNFVIVFTMKSKDLSRDCCTVYTVVGSNNWSFSLPNGRNGVKTGLFFHDLVLRAGIFKKSMGARHRGGIGFLYRPARLHRLAEFIPWHQFRGPINI